MSNIAATRCILVAAVATLAVGGDALAAAGTTYKLGTVTGVETLNLSGPTMVKVDVAGTPTSVPASLAIKVVVRWTARSGEATTLTRTAPGGQGRICGDNTCPRYGPIVGTATMTGNVTPTGGTPISCATSKGLKALYGTDYLRVASSRLEMGVNTKGSRPTVRFSLSQYQALLPNLGPASCGAALDASVPIDVSGPFPVSKLGAASLSLEARTRTPIALSDGTPNGITGTLQAQFRARLAKA